MIVLCSMAAFHFPGQTNYYSGKVRDVYFIGDHLLIMIASNRISAFDVILPREIPFKGQVLNQVAEYMLQACSDTCPHWLLQTPAPNVSLGWRCDPIKLEMVVRGNLTGHAWRTYQSGSRILCGVGLPDGMKENDYFPSPIITPTTKASEGHDIDISEAEIFNQHLTSEEDWNQLKRYSLALFEKGKQLAAKQGLILVDTKYEFGKKDGKIILMDEIHTPDSSRYFYAEGFEERQQKNEKQKQLSKEFVREWLIENNFMGKEGQQVPAMSDKWINTISLRYIELFEKLTGQEFLPSTQSDAETVEVIIDSLHSLGLG
ncbi:MAG: phosphoribosylaminoimidazolesuccinocarboxamide synthase [Ferruginibacter sp.]